jgi:hypothetical protein
VQHGCRVSNGLKSAESYSSGAASKCGSPSQQLPPTNTDAQGLFSVWAIPQGADYTLDVAVPGCGTNSLPVPAVGSQTNQIQLTLIVLKLANRQVAGRVIDQDGNPCWGAQACIRCDRAFSQAPGRRRAFSASNKNDRFDFIAISTLLCFSSA